MHQLHPAVTDPAWGGVVLLLFLIVGALIALAYLQDLAVYLIDRFGGRR